MEDPDAKTTPAVVTAWAGRLASRHGESGCAWLETLPARLAAVQRRWGWRWTLEAPIATAAHLLVPAVMPDGEAVLVKLGWPDIAFGLECKTLQHWGGHDAPAVALRAVDEELAGAVLDRIVPGDPLGGVACDVAAVEVWAKVAVRLHAASVSAGERGNWPHLSSWLADLDILKAEQTGRGAGVPPALIDNALQFRAELLADPTDDVLLHGDLHDANIVRGAEDAWWAIDPKGVVGDPAYDAAPFLINRLERWTHGLPPEDVQMLVGAAAASLGVAAERVARWLVLHAVLSSWWLIEDGADDEASRRTCTFRLGLAERLSSILAGGRGGPLLTPPYQT